MTLKARAKRALIHAGFLSQQKETKDYPFHGDRFTAYKRGTSLDFQRARAQYIQKYGKKSWRKEIKPILRGDKLNIFNKAPSRRRVFFINRVAWSSEQRITKSKKLGEIVHGGVR